MKTLNLQAGQWDRFQNQKKPGRCGNVVPSFSDLLKTFRSTPHPGVESSTCPMVVQSQVHWADNDRCGVAIVELGACTTDPPKRELLRALVRGKLPSMLQDMDPENGFVAPYTVNCCGAS